MLLAGDQGLQSSTHGRPLNPALFHCRKNRPKKKNLLFFKGYDSASVTRILIPGALSLFPKEYNMLHHSLVMQMRQRSRCEGGTTRTPCPGDAGDGLVQPQLCHGSCICQDDAFSLATATGVCGWPVGVRVRWVAPCRPWKMRGAGVQLYRAVLAQGGQGIQPSPSSSRKETGCEKQEVKPSLSSRGFGRGPRSRPDPGSQCRSGCTHTGFHPCSHQEAPGTFTSTCKRAMHFTLTHVPLLPLRHSLR